MRRRTALKLFAAGAVLGPGAWSGCGPAEGAAEGQSSAGAIRMVVHKDPSCGCCSKWVVLARDAGFEVDEQNTTAMAAVKQRLGVPARLQSCHTAEVGGYIVEGHVPIDLVKRLLAEKPAEIVGIAVPGMPTGSPGMEVPGRAAEPYDVIAWDRSGKTLVYERR
jgi:hypothetical protein